MDFQPLQHTDKLKQFTQKDWGWMVCKEFPSGGIVSGAVIMQIEAIGWLDSNGQKKEEISTLLRELSTAFAIHKETAVQSAKPDSNLEVVRNESTVTPIKFNF